MAQKGGGGSLPALQALREIVYEVNKERTRHEEMMHRHNDGAREANGDLWTST